MSITFMEFFGLPGCGKTSVLYETANIYGEGRGCYYPNMLKIRKKNGEMVVDSAYKHKNSEIFRTALRMRSIKTLFNIFSLYLKSKTRTREVFRFYFTLYLYFLNLVSTTNKLERGLVLSDNGFVQIMISILKRSRGSKLTYEDFFRILDGYDFAFNFVYLELTPALSRARIYHRGKELSIMQDGEEAALEQLAFESELFNRVYDEMDRKYKCYKLDSSQRLEDVMDEIEGIIE